MHELTIATEIVNIVAEKAKQEAFSNVDRITIEIGRLSGVNPHCLSFVFPEAARGTPLEGCYLNLVDIPVDIACRQCDNTTIADETLLVCSTCGSQDIKINHGKELRITNLEVQ